MKYSVLMSVYRGERAERLTEAAESMLGQTVPPDEFLLVCDGPLTEELDGAVDALQRKYPEQMRVVRLPENRGLGAALNAGLALCRNDLVARMDSDDVALPRRMEVQLKPMEEDSKLAAVGGQTEEFVRCTENKTGRRQVPTDFADIKKLLPRRNPMNHMTVTFRREAVLAAGGYPNLLWFEDYGLWACMAARGMKLANVDEVCVLARADREMYRRRGGWRYARQSLRMMALLGRLGLASPLQCAVGAAVRTAAAVLFPAGLRQILYRHLLRKEAGV